MGQFLDCSFGSCESRGILGCFVLLLFQSLFPLEDTCRNRTLAAKSLLPESGEPGGAKPRRFTTDCQ
ncbi:hypothetical protein SBA1_460041 [Candidatus Sulfotelmatobacter kueseliae]|uniref:Uncharacterized protein n=1 Tax=Candidatus Sulfotelmatobacter kueseliae TaxID=2042962 RepID=A0A2U3KS20_9BACT|nr:hypothetical protein SBA1_460041 [Candidatus Sulfotelmatobacter kueseliae]